MIERELFERARRPVGRLRQGRLRGRRALPALIEAGLQTGTCPRSSSTTSRASPTQLGTRTTMSRYNVWLHTRLWDEEIEQAMASAELADASSEDTSAAAD